MAALPERIERILAAALVGEFTVVDRHGRPITHPMLPLYDGDKILLHSSILFSKKLTHIRNNPKVAIAITDPDACPGIEDFDRILVQGDARLLNEDDPHRAWEERVLPLWIAKEPMVEQFMAKRVALPLFFERIVIEVTPRRAFLWPGGRTDRAPHVFESAGVA